VTLRLTLGDTLGDLSVGATENDRDTDFVSDGLAALLRDMDTLTDWDIDGLMKDNNNDTNRIVGFLTIFVYIYSLLDFINFSKKVYILYLFFTIPK